MLIGCATIDTGQRGHGRNAHTVRTINRQQRTGSFEDHLARGNRIARAPQTLLTHVTFSGLVQVGIGIFQDFGEIGGRRNTL
jgi:hypothetical protein